jgi:hypothetical protein
MKYDGDEYKDTANNWWRRRWYNLVKKSLIIGAAGASIFGALKVADEVYHHPKDEKHLHEIHKYEPKIYKEAKMVTKDGDTIIVFIQIDDTSKIKTRL